MTKNKRWIKIKLNKLWTEYAYLHQRMNDVYYFLHVNEKSKWSKTFPNQIEFWKQHLKYLKKENKIIKERIDDLSKQFKESK